jgi:hypothetical protein
MFTGCGALVALILFLPLPARFQKAHIPPSQALQDTYYIVGTIAFLVSLACLFGLRNLAGEEGKSWRTFLGPAKSNNGATIGTKVLPYWRLLLNAIGLAGQDPLIALGYLGGFVARASSVGISLFIPLYVKTYYIRTGLCSPSPDAPGDLKSECRQAYILAAQLTGISQLTALLFAPVFGYVADRWRVHHLPLMGAAVAGVVGYGAFAGLEGPETRGTHGSGAVYPIVMLLGISQIGAIVCSLGLLGRGISGLESTQGSHVGYGNGNGHGNRTASTGVARFGTIDEDEESPHQDQEPLIPHDNVDDNTNGHALAPLAANNDLSHLKGSIAGVYSLAGGAGILLLTKLGGFLFDAKSTAAPFVMLAGFNVLLLVGGVGCSFWSVVRQRRVGREVYSIYNPFARAFYRSTIDMKPLHYSILPRLNLGNSLSTTASTFLPAILSYTAPNTSPALSSALTPNLPSLTPLRP